MKHAEAGVEIELVNGNIVKQSDLDAIVNAANAQLRTGGGVAGAIHRAAGPGLTDETRPLAPIEPSEAVITSAHDLPNDYIIHVLGPVYGQDEPSDKLLRTGYENALQRAEENDIASVGFPALSTGAFGYPMEEAAHIALRTMLDQASALHSIQHLRFVLFSNDDYSVHAEALTALLNEPNS